MNFDLTDYAKADLLEIWTSIAESSPNAATKVVDRLFEAFHEISSMPGIGHFREDLGEPEIKFFRVYDYLIAYKYENKPILILRVFHGARDVWIKANE